MSCSRVIVFFPPTRLLFSLEGSIVHCIGNILIIMALGYVLVAMAIKHGQVALFPQWYVVYRRGSR